MTENTNEDRAQIEAATMLTLCSQSAVRRDQKTARSKSKGENGTAVGLLLVGFWGEFTSGNFWKATVCISIFSVAIVHVCLLSIAKLAKRFQPIRFIGCQIIFGFAALLCTMILGEIDSSGLWRLVAATSIVIGAFSLSIPILHRISKLDRNGEDLSTPIQERNFAAIDDEIAALQKRIAELQKVRESLQLADNRCM